MNLITKLGRKIRSLTKRATTFLPYYMTMRRRLGITNTKYDITHDVWKDSYLRDQYRVQEFLDKIGPQNKLTFFDLGRNHGFVLLFALDHINRHNLAIDDIAYTGIDPSPLKFAFHPAPSANVTYRIIDRAIVYDGAQTAHFKYGEQNFGNFNIRGSDRDDNPNVGRGRSYIEIEVDTIAADQIMRMIDSESPQTALIVKMDFKNRCEVLFEQVIDALAGRPGPYLVACESFGPLSPKLAPYKRPDFEALVCSNIL